MGKLGGIFGDVLNGTNESVSSVDKDELLNYLGKLSGTIDLSDETAGSFCNKLMNYIKDGVFDIIKRA